MIYLNRFREHTLFFELLGSMTYHETKFCTCKNSKKSKKLNIRIMIKVPKTH